MMTAGQGSLSDPASPGSSVSRAIETQRSLSILTYNVSGNGTTDWSTNAPQVQAIGRQMIHLRPDIITFNEIPLTNSWQMAHFLRAYLPGYFLATNSGDDGYIRSMIASRHPITQSRSWLDGVSLNSFGYAGRFTRDLFEAQIDVPSFEQPLHVFTTHLKAGTALDDQSRRVAEARAISNFFVTAFLPGNGTRPYVLTGDLNEDVNHPLSAGLHPIAQLVSAPTGLRLTTPLNPIVHSDHTLSIRSSLFARYDYLLPGGLLFSNLTTNLVFRTDVLNPMPTHLLGTDSRTASDHLPVLAEFRNPYDTPFGLTSVAVSNLVLHLTWLAGPKRQYRVEMSSTLTNWTAVTTNFVATTNRLSWSTNAGGAPRFFRVYRLP